MSNIQPTNSDDDAETYLRAEELDVDGDGDRPGADGEVVEVKHKQEGVIFEATVDDDGYLRGAHDRYFPAHYYSIVNRSSDTS